MPIPFNDPRMVSARVKSQAGTLTFEELKEVIALMREGRVTAHHTSAKSRSAAAPIDATKLLESLELDL